ncbi:AsmA-like C-terminal region-containing protein [Puniceibacterium sp. IMCC21224]|uniref:YhdP family protein n=1 Tax=Puniceibacterium sp. IMCC21224 TaxID=1618204 RepID=UPI00065D3F50|nr:AsmA-like C-terminal region-containing protein [Puniceibacterium sp. IMCC21224]KMK67643.1 Protein of unknown function/AsmA-like C-terminal region [Puniceibacterium sp. IMCC21224]
MSDAQIPEKAAPKGTSPRRRGRRAGVWVLLSFTAFVIAAGVLGWAAMGRAVMAPQWLHSRIEARIADAVPGLRITFGALGVELDRSGLATLSLRDVDVATDTGAPVVALTDLEAGLSLRALARGQLALRRVLLNGAFLSVQRDRDGRVLLDLGPAFRNAGNAPDLPALIARIDTLSADPMLAGLESLEVEALTLRYDDARAGRGWTADGGRLRLAREGGALRLSGDLAVLGRGGTAATLEVNAESPIGRSDVVFGLVLRDLWSHDIASQSPALAFLDALEAPISGALRGGIDAQGQLGELSATLQISAGVLRPNRRTRPVPFTSARTYFRYAPATGTLTFDELSVDSALGTAVAEGRAQLLGLETGWPHALLGQFRVSRLTADPGKLFSTPIEVAQAEVDLKLDLAPFHLSVGRLRIEGPSEPLYLSGTAEAAEDGWRVALDGHMATTSADEVIGYWPPGVAPKTRDWVTKNVLAGQARDVQVALRAEPGVRPQLYLDFAFDGAQVRYARTLPVVEDGSGQLTLIGNRLSVILDHGHLTPIQGGQIAAAGSSFVIPDTRIKPPQGRVEVAAQSTIEAVLSLLNSEPLNIMQKAAKPVALADGHAAVRGWLELPLKKGVRLPDMDFDLSATLAGVRSEIIVPGKVLEAQALAVSVQPGLVRVEGKATLQGVPVQGSWSMPLGQPGAGSVVDGVATLSQSGAQALGIALPDGLVTGSGPAQVRIDLSKGAPPRFGLTSDLAGLAMTIAPIGWSLGRNTKARLEVSGTLGVVPDVDRLLLEAPGLRAEGRVMLRSDRTLDRVEFSRVRVGDWLDAPVTLTGRGAGATPGVTIRGGRVDLRRAPFGQGRGSGGTAGAGAPVTLALEQLQVSSGITLDRFRGDFTTRGGFQGNFTAALGQAPIRGQVLPQNGRSAFRIASDDAGEVLRGAGLLKTVQGGSFLLNMTPVRGAPGNYDGALDIRDVRLRDAPAIGALLDSISIVGLLDQLSGSGIYFAEVDADFRLTPEQVILKRSSATGPSMGLSMDGYYTLATKALDMQGVLSPIYLVNGIGALFTRKGEGLIGFNFNLTGAASSPRVAVNPLSVFTPGMFREIFRRAPPQTSESVIQ